MEAEDILDITTLPAPLLPLPYLLISANPLPHSIFDRRCPLHIPTPTHRNHHQFLRAQLLQPIPMHMSPRHGNP